MIHIKHITRYIYRVKVLVILLLSCGPVTAETPETEPDTVTGSVSAVSDTEGTPAFETRSSDYNIYRKNNPHNPCDRGLDRYEYEKNWYDETQVYINSRFCEPALWFDNFFANDRIFEEGAAGTYVRWRNEFTYDEYEHFDFKMGLSASVELPFFEEYLRLTLESDDDEDIRDIAPGEAGSTSSALGLQLDLKENARSKFSVSASFSPRIRFRYRYTYPVTDDITLRLTQELQRKKKVHSARTLFDFEVPFARKYLYRMSTEGKFSEEYDGMDWLQAFVIYKRVNEKTSVSYEASANGITQPDTRAINYRIGLRYRKNFHRKWLFYEVAPEITWPTVLTADRGEVEIDQHSKWLLFFRLEVHFGNAHKKRYQDYN